MDTTRQPMVVGGRDVVLVCPEIGHVMEEEELHDTSAALAAALGEGVAYLVTRTPVKVQQVRAEERGLVVVSLEGEGCPVSLDRLAATQEAVADLLPVGTRVLMVQAHDVRVSLAASRSGEHWTPEELEAARRSLEAGERAEPMAFLALHAAALLALAETVT